MKIQNIAIVTNNLTGEAVDVEKEVCAFLKDKGINYSVFDKDDENFSCADLAVVIGGDGTILNVGRKVLDKKMPIFGINTGHLGYLTATEAEFAVKNLERVFAGEYTVEERVTLTVKCKNKEIVCINEALFHRGSEPHLLTLDIEVSGHEIDEIRGDGLLVATPTGSTAYNLSAGGPIISPTAKSMALTPICVHSLTSRPIVLAEEDVIKITVKSDESPAQISVDGKSYDFLYDEETAEVKISDKKLLLIRTGDKSFYKILRKKLACK